MHYFEDKFSAVGRFIDRLFERMKDRSPRRYRPHTGPTLRERWREARDRTRERWKNRQRVGWRDWEPEQRRRVTRLAAVFGFTLLVGAGFWIWRTRNNGPSLQEMMEQATVRARMEMGHAEQNSPFKGWGEKK
jgi:hypothetical protein